MCSLIGASNTMYVQYKWRFINVFITCKSFKICCVIILTGRWRNKNDNLSEACFICIVASDTWGDLLRMVLSVLFRQTFAFLKSSEVTVTTWNEAQFVGNFIIFSGVVLRIHTYLMQRKTATGGWDPFQDSR